MNSSKSNPSPFLVRNSNNVNAQLLRAKGLLTMWDFLVFKERIGNTNIVLNKIDDPSLLKIMPARVKSRYFEDGRLNNAWRIRKRLGRYEKAKGLMETLTYDPKRIKKQEAWRSFGKDVRRFLNAINQYRGRRGWRRLHYFWVVEVQKGTGYPHVHIFFPNLKWLAPYDIINGNWRQGRANLEKSNSIKASCAGYICKYLRKMEGWTDLHQAMLWDGGCRMYGFSRGFMRALEKRAPEWEKWRIVVLKYPGRISTFEKSLEDGGYTIERNKTMPFSSN